MAELKPGDLIEIFRGLYQHWALYIGGGYVVHLATSSEGNDKGPKANSIPASKVLCLAEVKKERLQDMVGTHKWKVNNSLDKERQPRPSADIVRDAKAQVGTEVRCSVFTWYCEHFATDLRYGKPHSHQLEKELKPGDLIEIFRGFFKHWAVYIGGGYVVHLVPNNDLLDSADSASRERAEVMKELLQDVVGTDKWRENNYLDKKHDPRPSADIVSDAKALVGEEMRYSAVNWNCEHFATKLRYGKAHSRQVRDSKKTSGILCGGVVALVCLILGLSCRR